MRKLILEHFYRLAASGWVPRSGYAPALPPVQRPAAEADPPRPLRIEIVSHCWQYAAHLTYQLGSLVLYPPRTADVRMTVFHSPDDPDTVRLLESFARLRPPGVEWNWRALDRRRLFRRAIGRNLAALDTAADWIWFTDCDVLFYDGALDHAARVLRGRNDYLVFPERHGVTDLLESDDVLFESARRGDAGRDGPALLDIPRDRFRSETRRKAAGAFQIVRGDVARAAGYCKTIAFYHEPVDRWQKCYDDRALRWLLGTHGTPVDIPGIHRIRHLEKGRKTAPSAP